MSEAGQLGQYGLIGVMLALISLVGVISAVLWKLVSNHMEHSTQAWNRNTDAMIGMTKIQERLATLIETKLG